MQIITKSIMGTVGIIQNTHGNQEYWKMKFHSWKGYKLKAEKLYTRNCHHSVATLDSPYCMNFIPSMVLMSSKILCMTFTTSYH